MDEINNFFNFNRPIPEKPQTSTAPRQKRPTDPWDDELPKKLPEKSAKYAREHEKNLLERLKEEFYNKPIKFEEEDDDPDDRIYAAYNFNFRRKSCEPLPIEGFREQILETIKRNPIVVLQGATGCGKTTQVPQYILRDAWERRKYCRILVAQPRRIATSSNAKRVCKERNWPVGGLVGYQIGSDGGMYVSEDTRITYCTTGVLLEKLVYGKSLYPYTHIILDEVHERTKEMDFLMVIIKKFINRKVRIILMSATIDTQSFAEYFSLPIGTNARLISAPIINIDAKQNYSVKTFYLDDLQSLFGPNRNFEDDNDFDVTKPKIGEEVYFWALRLIVLFERADRQESIRNNVPIEEYKSRPKPNVLVFLPGINEINIFYHMLEEWKNFNLETQIVRIVLHSTAAPIQAEVALQISKKNIRKIILATNIAESSITVPDVKYVIDFCLTRSLVLDSTTNFTTLRLSWASHDNCNQRTGRTGRMMNGTCFRMVTKEFYTYHLQSSSEPEIVNNPLEDIVLKTKILNMGSPESILALAMDKPALRDIEKTIYRLKGMGALLRTTEKKIDPLDGDITFVGRLMSALPLDVKLSKLIILGFCFNMVEETIVIAAALNCMKSLFARSTMSITNSVERYTKLLEWADGSGSDLFAMLNAYTTWEQVNEHYKIGNKKIDWNQENERQKTWCDRFGLDLKALQECKELIKDIKCRLRRFNLRPMASRQHNWDEKEKNIILKVIISGAFYPNYFVRDSPVRARNEREMFELLGGNNPCNTIYFTNFEPKYVRHIYIKAIKDFFVDNGIVNDRDGIKVTIENGSQKIFVTFKSTSKKCDQKDYGFASMPGYVSTEVYKAIKMRQAKMNLKLHVFRDPKKAIQFACSQNLYIDASMFVPISEGENFEEYCFPKMNQQEVKGFITHIEDCDHFYLQPESESDILNEFYEELNSEIYPVVHYDSCSEVEVGEVVAVPYSDGKLYRGKVILVKQSTHKNAETKFFVQFIDFGNTEIFGLSDLRKLTGVFSRFIETPPRSFKCALVGVQPSLLNAPNGAWPQAAINLFRQQTDHVSAVTAKIFSICDGTVRVHLYVGGKSFNDLLVEKKYADRCEENFMSKADNRMRNICTKHEDYFNQSLIDYLKNENLKEIEPPVGSTETEIVMLKGGFTPLEVCLNSVTGGSNSRSATVDSVSVNSVLLENEPYDISLKYIVAVSACEKGDTKLDIRNTTLMPNIRGFGAMMAAIFSPFMQLSRDKDRVSYDGMITGLGCDERNRPIFPEEDMVFDLDTEFTFEDFDNINRIRNCINSLLPAPGENGLAVNFDDFTKRRHIFDLKDLIIK